MSMSDPSGPTALSSTIALAAWIDEHAEGLYGPDALTDATREDLAIILHHLSATSRTLADLASLASTELAGLMEGNEEQVGRFHLKRTRTMKTEWDSAGWRQAAIDAAIPQLALNPETGEIVPSLKMAVGNAMRVAFRCITPSTAPSVTGLRALEIEPGDYRATTPGAWRVTVTEENPDVH
jgi:hypothetical protein